jgi:hypothetical protein
VNGLSNLLCEGTGSYLERDQLKTYSEYGGKRVYVSFDDKTDPCCARSIPDAFIQAFTACVAFA